MNDNGTATGSAFPHYDPATTAPPVDRLREALAAWKELAMSAIDCLHDVERETDWGQPLFAPSIWERHRSRQNDLLAAETKGGA